jgi:predicted phosphodiesterase
VVLAIISDTHLPRGRRALPAACVERLRAADLVLHAGDFTAAALLDELEALGPPVAAVFGHSHIPLHERDPATGFQIFNPGSPTDRRRQPHHTMGLARTGDCTVAFELVVLD